MRGEWMSGAVGWVAGAVGWQAAPAAQADARQAGLDAAITVEAVCVTFVGVARQRGATGDLDLGPEAVRFLRATQCQDEAHYHFLASIGAQPRATAFALPERGLTDRAGFFQALIDLEAIGVGVHMAAARRFATEGDPRLVEVAYAMGAVDAQHLALTRSLLGVSPANDRAFARWRFVEMAEAAAALAVAGFGEGGAGAVAFPGPVARLCAGVFGLVPETTDDALLPRPAVGTPVDGEG